MSAEVAILAVRARAAMARGRAAERWQESVGDATGESLDRWAQRLGKGGRLTVNFHPDRVGRQGLSVAGGLLQSGRYHSQWVTGLSAGGRSAVRGGEREGWERAMFGGAYDGVDPTDAELPVYGALDLVCDPHGGSPRFGSSFVVLHRHVLDRTTLCLGGSQDDPQDVGTIDDVECILAGLAEQAARCELLNRGLGVADLLQACLGTYHSAQPSRDLDGFIEAQVHGGISLTDDVAGLVLDPSFRATPVEHDLTAAAERYDFSLSWHNGSEIHVDEVPDDFRGPTMPTMARRVARPDGVVDAHAIGTYAESLPFEEPSLTGDPPESELQQLKFLWHTLLAFGHDA